MKKIFLIALLCFIAFIQGCSKKENDLDPTNHPKEINLPKESHEFGKAVAKEIRSFAINFYQKGIDYTQADKSPLVRKQVIGELFEDIPAVQKAKSSVEPLSFEMSVPAENIAILTERQQNAINEIYEDYNTSQSNEEFFQKLKITTDEIYKLPKIEQERVFNLSATLYYGLQEIESLKREGLMASTSNNSYFGKCVMTEVNFPYPFPIPIGYEIIVNGAKYVVVQSAYAAARAVWIVAACAVLTSSSSDCQYFGEICAGKQWKIENGKPVRMNCTICLEFCHRNGYWNHAACPLK